MEFPVWLWRPNVQPESPVKADDYKCCYFCGCSSKCWFTLCTAIWILASIIFIASAIFVFLVRPDVTVIALRQPGLYLRLAVIVLGFLAVRAIMTKKPGYMQAFIIVFASLQALTLLAEIFFGHHRDQGYNYEGRGYRDDTVGYNDGAMGYRNDHIGMWEITERIPGLIIGAIVAIWMNVVVYMYYSYIRDRQLEVEQQELCSAVSNFRWLELSRMGFPVWLWRPKVQPKSPVEPGNYLCCGCCCCTAKCCFTFDTIIWVISAALFCLIVGISLIIKPLLIWRYLENAQFFIWGATVL
ncbi:unnamed protein product, partial [Mesorhabditis spiculigera]